RPATFETYCAVAFTGIGDCLPDDLLSRTIAIHMFRNADAREKFRPREHGKEADKLREAIGAWADQVRPVVQSWDAAKWKSLVPDRISGRDADNWEPLLAVGYLVSPEWYRRISDAALVMVAEAADNAEQTTPNQLLSDVRDIFEE